MKNLIFILALIALWSCKKEAKQEKNTNIIATINESVNITYTEIDNLMSQKIFDELNEIYYVRKIALDRVLRSRLIELEAKKKSQSSSDYLESKINSKITEAGVQKFVTENNLVNSLPQISGDELEYGRENLKERDKLHRKYYHEFLYNKLTDSLMQAYEVLVNLKPPRSPKIDMDNILAFYTGKLNSNITLWIVSDLECSVCKEIDPQYNLLINEYKNEIRIAFVPYSSDVNTSMKLAYYANEKELFWEFREYIQNLSETATQHDFELGLIDLGLTDDSIEDILLDDKIYKKLSSNIEVLNDMGFYGTPTLLLNGRYIDPFDIKNIKKTIDQRLGR